VTDDATILVVDDLAQNIRLLEAVLGPHGYVVVSATSGDEALACVRSQPVDLVLLDIVMPGMDGYEVCRTLRADDSTPTTWFGPILAEIFGTLPTDAAQRIRAGAGGGISATYSRTAMSARDEFQPENVYDLLPAVQAQRLRGIASALGY